MIGSWDDFTSKYGFGDGEQLEDIDFAARTLIVERLNQLPEFHNQGIRAVAYDRPGLHNACLIVLLPALDGKSDDELLELWQNGTLTEVELPECEVDDPDNEGFWDIHDIVIEAYASVWHARHWPALSGVDWNLLYQQKMELVKLEREQKEATVVETLEGVIHFLDALLDDAEERGLFHHPLA